jgi:hypothetical protein
MNKITYDFQTNQICNQPESDNYKTIKYKMELFTWFCVYQNDFNYIHDLSKEPIIYNFIKNGQLMIESTEEYYSDSGEYCKAYKYIYSLNNEEIILYKIIPYKCDWVANPYGDDIEESINLQTKVGLLFGLMVIILHHSLRESWS